MTTSTTASTTSEAEEDVDMAGLDEREVSVAVEVDEPASEDGDEEEDKSIVRCLATSGSSTTAPTRTKPCFS